MSDQRFLVSARKYRPLLFEELVAQEHVTGTLQNAIRLDRLAHAYLFTGPRGVGKTTAARILAKAINCTTPLDKRSGGAEPCRVCESCLSFEEGRNLNIIEIDAASNNRVDDVRDLRDTVRIPPQGAVKKVYIVDEVHMLTTQAFNALLKTLEEPPPHVLFIFATTEPHKVLPTIQSRCQRFDFRRIPVQEIVGRLEDICKAEGVSADDGALMLLARKGDGALRDSLSVFDQAVSLCGTDLKLDTLVDALGVVSEELYFEVTDHILAQDVAGMLGLVDRIVGGGFDLQEFLDGLAEHLRNILVALTMPDTALIEASDATRARYVTVAKRFTENHVMRLLAGIDHALDGLRSARQPRLRLELSLIRMASLPSSTDIRSALAQVKALAAQGEAIDGDRVTSTVASDQPVNPQPATSGTSQVSPARPAVKPAPVAKSESEGASSTSLSDQTGAQDGGQNAAQRSMPPTDAAEPSARPASPKPTPSPVEVPSSPALSPSGPALSPSGPAPAPSSPALSPNGPALSPSGPALSPSGPARSPSAPASAPHRPAPSPPAPSGPSSDPSETAPPPVDPDQRTLFGKASGMGIFGKPAISVSALSEQPVTSGTAAADTVTLAVSVGTLSPEDWQTVVSGVMASKIHMGAFLHHAEPEIRDPSCLTLVIPDDFHARVLKEAAPDILAELKNIGQDGITRLEFDVNGRVRAESEITTQEIDPQAALAKLCEEYPAMALLMERFGGEIVW